LLPTEQLYLDVAYRNKTQYNTCCTAGNRLGVKASKKTKAKLRLSHIGNTSRVGVGCTHRRIKNKISASLKGRTVWNKGKRGVQTAWNKGKSPSIETKAKMSQSHFGKKAYCEDQRKK